MLPATCTHLCTNAMNHPVCTDLFSRPDVLSRVHRPDHMRCGLIIELKLCFLRLLPLLRYTGSELWWLSGGKGGIL